LTDFVLMPSLKVFPLILKASSINNRELMDSLGNSYRQTAGILSEYPWPRETLPSSKAVMTGSSKVAIIGAGPYGLSIAAHLRAQGISFRIFGSPMHS
jgi:NADPH-dependent 2,4-dienoyl-CoA reductase/sulfur reductase-like enzyme